MKEIWFISGPMRGLPQFNFPAFLDAEIDLRTHFLRTRSVGQTADWEIHNPAAWDIENGADVTDATGTEPVENLPELMAWCMARVAESTDILFLPGWYNSAGAKAEKALADALGLRQWALIDGQVKPLVKQPALYSTQAPRVFPCLRGGESRFTTTATVHPDGTFEWNDPQSGPSNNDATAIGVEPLPSDTGGRKGRKQAELGWVDPLALDELAKVAGYGASKYENGFNYLKGFPFSWSYNAQSRHERAHWAGEDRDPESGLLHQAHAAWHALCQASFLLRGIGTDDRPKT